MKKHFKNINITADRRYSRSYGSPITTAYALAMVEGNWIYLYNEAGAFVGKSKTDAKHFHSYDGERIDEVAFNRLLAAYSECFTKERDIIKNAEQIVVQKVEAMPEVVDLWNKVEELKRNGTHKTTGSKQVALRRAISKYYKQVTGVETSTWMFPLGTDWGNQTELAKTILKTIS